MCKKIRLRISRATAGLMFKRRRHGIADSLTSTILNSEKAVVSPVVEKDWKLVQQALSGDKHAREELFAAHTARLYRTAYSVLHNKEDAEDAMQNSSCNAFINLRFFKGQSSFATWLIRIVINSALLIRRKRIGHRETSLDEMIDCQPQRLRDRVFRAGPNPEKICAINQIRERLTERSFQLPPAVRSAFQLYVLEGSSAADSCDALGIRRAAFKGRILRARRILIQSFGTKRLLDRHSQFQRRSVSDGCSPKRTR